jgi:GAF domain
MISAPVFWGVACGAIYFLAMWWVHSRRLERQRDSTRLLYALSEQIVAAHTPSGIVERLRDTMPRLLRGARVEMDLGQGKTRLDSLVLPLTSHDQTLGAIALHRASGIFTPEERGIAQHIANIVAAALQLQKHQTQTEKSSAPQPSAPADHPPTFMLIDSDPESRRAVLHMLNSRGYRAIPAAPEEVDDLARRMKFDAVLRVDIEVRQSAGNQICLSRPVSDEKLDQVFEQNRTLRCI